MGGAKVGGRCLCDVVQLRRFARASATESQGQGQGQGQTAVRVWQQQAGLSERLSAWCRPGQIK